MKRDGKIIIITTVLCILILSAASFLLAYELGYSQSLGVKQYSYSILDYTYDAGNTLNKLEIRYYIPSGDKHDKCPVINFVHGDNNRIADENMLKSFAKSGIVCAYYDYNRKISVDTSSESNFKEQIENYAAYVAQTKFDLPYEIRFRMDGLNEYYFGDGYGAIAVLKAVSNRLYYDNIILQNPDNRFFTGLLDDKASYSMRNFCGRQALVLQGDKCKNSSIESSQELIDYINKKSDRAEMIVYKNQSEHIRGIALRKEKDIYNYMFDHYYIPDEDIE